MNEKFRHYLNDDYDYEGGSLVFSCSQIEIAIHKGEIVEGSFTIEEQSGLEAQGDIYSSHIRMTLGSDHFKGKLATVHYRFDSNGLTPGEVVKGCFSIISDKGEYILSYVITILYEQIESSLGNIKNLFHFTNLAKSNWDEAVKLFSKNSFIDIISESDKRYKSLYYGLSSQGNQNRNLEEFLIGINKKQKIEYVVSKDSIRIENPQEQCEQRIKIERNGWGYIWIAVKADGDFISLEKSLLNDSDFLGNSCHLSFQILSDKLHEGKNLGRIRFYHMYGTFDVNVLVVVNKNGRKNLSVRRKKSQTYALTRHFLDFRMKKITLSKWLLLTNEILAHRKSIEEDNIENSLFEAHLLMTQERFNEAKWILDHQVEPLEEELSDELYCYYLYLTTLYNVDEYYTREMADRVENIYVKDKSNWRIAWLILCLSEELNRDLSKKWQFSLKQVEEGCSSPLFYLEMIRILNASPSLLTKIHNEVKKVLLFGAKQDILSPELMEQIAYLALHYRNYDEKLLWILRMIYDKTGSNEAIQAICILLMKGGKTGGKCFKWYELAVEQNFPLTRLYEYYMMSMDLMEEKPIPKRVLMYFSYQSNLQIPQNAYLYAYIVRNKEKYPDIYLSYHEQICRFLIKQLYAGKIDRNLAYLYQEIIMKEMLTPDNARQFATLLFVHYIRVKDSRLTNVVVIDERVKQERKYPISNGGAYVALTGNDYVILLEDLAGNRYYQTKEYTTERYFLPRKLLPTLEPYADNNLLFNLFVCEENQELIIITQQNRERYHYLAQSERVAPDFRSAIRMKILTYLFERDEGTAVDEMLHEISQDDVREKDRNELIRIMAIRGFYKKAFEFAVSFGAENVDAKVLVRVAAGMIEAEGCIQYPEMTYLVYSAFERGKYNETVLQYLVRYYRGLAKNLRNIWKAANNFCVDTYSICEKMMIQTIETGAFIGDEVQILQQYVNGGGRLEVEQSYLSYCAYEYFVNDRVIDAYFFHEMERVYQCEKEISQVCMLAYLKYQSQNVENLTEESKNVIVELLRNLYLRKHIVMPFFVKFQNFSIEALELSNLSLIEYKGNPKSRVVLHYVITKEHDETNGYIKEEMTNMYGGIFVKSFLLFFGETLQYYITEEYENKEQLTESGSIRKNDAIINPLEDRYNAVNDISIATTLKDYDTSLQLLKDYEYKKYLVEHIFIPQ